jgi:hypothetical protein
MNGERLAQGAPVAWPSVPTRPPLSSWVGRSACTGADVLAFLPGTVLPAVTANLNATGMPNVMLMS